MPARLASLLIALAAALALAACDTGDAEQAQPDASPPPTAEEDPSPGRSAAPGDTPEASPGTPGTPVTPTPGDHEPAAEGLAELELPDGASGGVTAEPCPSPVNPGNGCIYLGALEDRDGDGTAVAAAHAEARRAYWRRVNQRGGIAGHDVDVSTYARDSGADPDGHAHAFEEIRGEVVALAQSQGIAATAAIAEQLDAAGTVALPAAPLSAWTARDVTVVTGSTVCADAANGVDHVAEHAGAPGSVAVLHYPGAYGEDAAAGVAAAGAHHGAEVTTVTVQPRDGKGLVAAVDEAVATGAELLVVATGPSELGAAFDRALEQGYPGLVVAPAQAWDPGLLSGRADALARRLRLVGPLPPWGAATAGHEVMREELSGAQPSEAHVTGWARQYVLAAGLRAAADAGDLSARGLRRALADLETVDSGGMLPPSPREVRASVVSVVDSAAPTGLRLHRPFFSGPSARALDMPCAVQG